MKQHDVSSGAARVRILRRPAVADRTGLSPTSLWRHIQRGEFPKPVSLGPRAVGWVESEVDAWIEARARARNA